MARWLWAVSAAVVLGGLAVVLVLGSAARTRLERTLMVLIVLSMNPAGVAVGNGQYHRVYDDELILLPMGGAVPDREDG